MQNVGIPISCQTVTVRCASTLVPNGLRRMYQLQGHWKKQGMLATLRKIGSWLLRTLFPAAAAEATPTPRREDEVLHLQPGEWVETKSYDDILQTLDSGGRHRGLLFMPDMAQYCGRRFRVFKPIERLLMEDTGELRRMRNTVLLEGVMCQGLHVGCDRSCFHFWREAWLRRVNGAVVQIEREYALLAQ